MTVNRLIAQVAICAAAACAAGDRGVGTMAAADPEWDLVVYGGTAGGVITAVAAAREGARVALLEPHDHLDRKSVV